MPEYDQSRRTISLPDQSRLQSIERLLTGELLTDTYTADEGGDEAGGAAGSLGYRLGDLEGEAFGADSSPFARSYSASDAMGGLAFSSRYDPRLALAEQLSPSLLPDVYDFTEGDEGEATTPSPPPALRGRQPSTDPRQNQRPRGRGRQ